MEELKKFLEALRADPKAAELLKDVEKPSDPKELAECYVGIAGKLGYEVSEKDITEGSQALAKEQADQTRKTKADIKEIPEDEMQKVAGGELHGKDCEDTFLYFENCWLTDGCDVLNTWYDDYECWMVTRSDTRCPVTIL